MIQSGRVPHIAGGGGEIAGGLSLPSDLAHADRTGSGREIHAPGVVVSAPSETEPCGEVNCTNRSRPPPTASGAVE